MEKFLFDVSKYDSSIRSWWIYMLLGLLYFVVGILVFMRPAESYLALSVTFGIMVVVSGIMAVYIGATTAAHQGKGRLIAAGVIELLLGIALFILPNLLIGILPYILAFWLMFRGYMTFMVASDMIGDRIKGAGWTMILAILLIISSFMVLIYPAIGVGAMIIWLGVSLLLAGASLVAFSIYLNRLRKFVQ